MKEMIQMKMNEWNENGGIGVTAIADPIRNFLLDEEGVGTIEIVLILVVLIALVLIFRTRLTALIKKVFDAMDESAAELYENRN